MQALDILWENYVEISLIVLLITISIVAIVYMIGKILGRREIEDYATGEVYQGIASAFIIAAIIALLLTIDNIILAIFQDVGLSCTGNTCFYNNTEVKGRFGLRIVPLGFELKKKVENCSQDILKTNDSCHMKIARARLNTLNNVVKAYTASKIMTYGWIFTLETISIGVEKVEEIDKYTGVVKRVGIIANKLLEFLPSEFAPFSWISMIREAFKVIYSVLYTISIYLSGVDMFLEFVEAGMFSIFLVSGIILRTFTPTRRLGGLLIAIAIGIYLIFPTLLILVSLVAPNTTFELEDFENVFTHGGEAHSFPGVLWVFFKNVAGTGLNFPSYLAVEIFKPFEKAAILFVWIFVQQLIIIYATVVSIREISQFLGGDIEIAGLTRLL